MSMMNMQMDSGGRRVVGPADVAKPKEQEPMVTLYNIGFEKDTLLHINHSVIKMPEPGKAFAVPKRNARLLMRLHGRRAGGKVGIAARPDGSQVQTPQAPPGFRLVPNEEYDRLTGKTADQKSPAIVPDRVRILEEELAAAKAAQAQKISEAQAPAAPAVVEDEFELDLVAGDIPDEIIEVHNTVSAEMELEDIMDDLDGLDE